MTTLPTQAVYLAAGEGTRLGSLTATTPKPLLPVSGKPFLDYLLEDAKRFGITHVVILVGHLGEHIQNRYEGKENQCGLKITCIAEDIRSDTGILSYARDVLDEEFFVLNADSFFDFNMLDLALSPNDSDWVVKMALREVPDGSRSGAVLLDASGTVTDFKERGEAKKTLINAGVYVMRKSVLEYLPSVPYSLEKQVFPALVREGRLRAKPYEGYFIDIGTPEDYERAQTEFVTATTRPAVFFDRDGVLNENRSYTRRQGGYHAWVPDDFAWREGAIDAVKYANDNNHLTFVVTNQAGIARGYYTESDVETLHAYMQETLRAHGAHIDGFYFCPHVPETDSPDSRRDLVRMCDCRKPAPGLLTKAFSEWPIDRTKSFLVGDTTSDTDAANAAGIASINAPEGPVLNAIRGSIMSSIARASIQ
jgi:D-glycero-D-manno-heptose 1,7-bisphosphate phosphatase